MPAPPSRATAALRTPPPADSAPGGEVPKNVLKAATDGRVGPVRLWLNEGGKADTLFDADYVAGGGGGNIVDVQTLVSARARNIVVW